MFCLSLSVALISMAAGEHLAHCCSIKKSSHSHTTLLYFASCAKALFLSDHFFLHCFLIILLSDLISVKVQDARFLIEEEKKSSWQYLVLRDTIVSFLKFFPILPQRTKDPSYKLDSLYITTSVFIGCTFFTQNSLFFLPLWIQ